MTRAVIIANPNASRHKDARLQAALKRLRAGGLDVEVNATREPGHGGELARAALDDGADMLIAHGGDGTLMEIAPVIAGTGRPLGLLPAGTGNRLADNLGIPWSPHGAADTILAGRTRAIDVGRMKTAEVTRYFAVAAGCGFDAEVMERATAELKRRWGVGAYFGTAFRLAVNLPRAHLRIEADGQVYEREAVSVLLANAGEILPTRRKFAPHIILDDGMLDIIILEAAGIMGALHVAARLASGFSGGVRGITFLRAKQVRITSETPMAAQADGELCGHLPLDAELLAGALTVLAPPAR